MIQVLDKFLPEGFENNIENLLFNVDFPWFFNSQTVYEDMHKGYFFNDKNTVTGSQFNHTFLYDNKINSDFCTSITPILFYLGIYSKVKVDKPIRIKANLTMPDVTYDRKWHRPAHYDTLENNVITAIYYVNDSDGDTIFFEDPEDKSLSNVHELKEIKRITPKKGQLVYFDSKILHSNALNKNTKHRCVINFNFVQ